jgi:predicted DNA-binding protein with PD1-like motif
VEGEKGKNEYMDEKIKLLEGTLSSRAAIIRVLPGFDVIEGIEEACRKLGITSGAIISCIGSLQWASVLVAVPLNNKIGAGYSEPRYLEGPLELLSGQGTIGREEEGNISIHMHGVISDKEGRLHGGHLIKGQNPVLITCELMLARIEGIRIIRGYDPEVDMQVFLPKKG